MSPKEKGKFEDMAKQDKVRYEKEMKNYVPPKGHKKKRFKDPNAPKRPPYVSDNGSKLCFCNPSMSQLKIPDALSPQVCILPVLRWIPPQGEEWESRTHDWRHGQETGWDVEQQNCGGQAAVREESCQAEGEVRQGNNSLSKRGKNYAFLCTKKPICYPQDVVAYRTKGKVDSESAATADDDDEEEEEEGEEEEDDDEEDDE